MNDSEYTFAVARIRVHETRLLTAADLGALVAAKSHEDAVRRLREKGYDFSEGDAAALEKKLRETWALLSSILPDERQMDALLIRSDFHNLKVLLKALVCEKDARSLFSVPSKYDPEALKPLVFQRLNEKLPEELRHADRSAYNILSKTRFAQLSDSVIDRAAMEWSIAYAKKADDPLLLRLTQLQTALTDVRIAYRCILAQKAESFKLRALCDCDAFTKQELAVPETTEALLTFLKEHGLADAADALREGAAALEKYADDAETALLRPYKYAIDGIGPLLGYWHAVNVEVRNLRILLSGKQTGQSDEIIRERMRLTYV